jgi:hypothetical protein
VLLEISFKWDVSTAYRIALQTRKEKVFLRTSISSLDLILYLPILLDDSC